MKYKPISVQIKKMTKPKLMDLLREQIRLKHYSIRTEKTYSYWTKQYVYYFNKKHPAESIPIIVFVDFVSKLEQESHTKKRTLSFAGAWQDIDNSVFDDLTNNLINNRQKKQTED